MENNIRMTTWPERSKTDRSLKQKVINDTPTNINVEFLIIASIK